MEAELHKALTEVPDCLACPWVCHSSGYTRVFYRKKPSFSELLNFLRFHPKQITDNVIYPLFILKLYPITPASRLSKIYYNASPILYTGPILHGNMHFLKHKNVLWCQYLISSLGCLQYSLFSWLSEILWKVIYFYTISACSPKGFAD